ncbi:hypothetical protein [Paenibacillus sp. 7516]|uniref:hypothetical protein n=1 Tax=Paenibacillus sp. 7516 TaxID=2022549 RepID=UPI000BA70448|nr:hypothetical protein [Paenibacillus sp. 7516]PAF31717.1 hypothetical protein CHI14_11295 [Paenibacillus sp. 7516]
MWGQDTIEFLIDDFLKYIGGISITALVMGAIFLILKTTTNSMITSSFNKNLESHKAELTKMINAETEQKKSELAKVNDKFRNELNAEIEKLKHEQQRAFKDFELYISKKHERYPEVYKSIETAYGAIFSLHGKYRDLSFENVNKDDVKAYLEMEGVTKKDMQEIMDLWVDGEPNADAVMRINSVRRRIKINSAYESWSDANDTLIFNELYLSESVSEQARKVLNKLWEYLDLEEIYGCSYEEILGGSNVREEMKQEKEKLKNVMKTELSQVVSL